MVHSDRLWVIESGLEYGGIDQLLHKLIISENDINAG
jgi:hypothetical protein